MYNYVEIARAAVESLERDAEAPPLMFEEFQVPLMLEVLNRLDRIINLLDPTSGFHPVPEVPSRPAPNSVGVSVNGEQ